MGKERANDDASSSRHGWHHLHGGETREGFTLRARLFIVYDSQAKTGNHRRIMAYNGMDADAWCHGILQKRKTLQYSMMQIYNNGEPIIGN
jgi:hypothetical protein